MPDPQPITLLHVSDMQFGRNHRFGALAAGDPEADIDTLYARLAEDLKRLTRTRGLRPQVIIVSGDLAEWGLASEFKDAFEFLDRLAAGLDIPRRNVVVVPGNHDVNRKLCESYFSECDGEEKQPVAPYARKWEPYRKQFDEFFAGAGVEFTVAHPWSMWQLDELRLVVAGLNSTMQESHREEDHYGWVGERQLQWFEEQLGPYVERGWLRIGVVHHNVCRGAMDDDENLRDASDLQARLGSCVNLLLHGHTHEGKTAWLHGRLPVLSTGSAALNVEARPPEVPNQYQVIRIHPDRVERWARRYQPRTRSWAGDTDASGDGSTWHIVDDVPFEAVHATFGSASATTHRPRAPLRADESGAWRADDFTGRVAEICELRHGGEGRRVTVQRLHAGSGHEYLGVYVADDQRVRSFPVAVAPSGITMELIQTFCEAVFEPYYWSLDRSVACEIVYSGERAAEELIDRAGARNVLLRSFLELQGIIDFRGYVDRQTARLASDVVYPPELYVTQRLVHEIGDERVESDDALAQIFAWLREPRARFVLLLGDFGTGKTFLLHELARRMPQEIQHLVPVLIELRSLEKAHSLEQLVAQHLAAAGERYIDLEAFPYMLREGRIALLFDGFDELAQRVTYQRATEHFETLMQAAGGNAKVVVTSRTQHFESDRQVKLALAERAEMLPSLSLCRLQPFDGDQILEFLERRLGDAGEARERLALIEEIRDLLGLSQNPRMLGFIAALPAQQLRDARERTGAITPAELYRLLIDEWLQHEAVKIASRGSAPSLSKNERLAAVTALALSLWSKLERTIHVSELSAELSAAAADLSTGPDGGGPPDRDRLAHLVGSRTLLVRDGEGAFAFVHQSVMEWLVADHAARQLDADRVPEALLQRKLTHLMVDFLCDLAGHERARTWARAVLDADERGLARANALLVLDRLDEQISGAARAGGELAGQDLTDRDLRGADLAGADLSEARMAGADLRDANLRGATLVRADLTGARLAGAALDGADARGASLLGADLRGARLGTANLRRAKLTGARIDGGALDACDTFGAALPDIVVPEPMLASAESSCGAIAFHPSGDLVASCHGSGNVELWDPATGTLLRTLTGHENWIHAVAFSPDGLTLATAGDDRSVRLWNPATGELVRTLTGSETWGVWAVAFSPDGQTLATAGTDRTVRLWNPTTGRPLRALTGKEFGIWAVAFSPDGHTLATASDDRIIRLWDVTTGGQVHTLTGHEDRVEGLAFSPDGHILASASHDLSIRLWDPATGHEVRTITGHKGGVLAVAFSPDGHTLATAGNDRSARLWDPTTGHELRTLTGHENWVEGVAFSPDGHTLATGSRDRSARLWNVMTGRHLHVLNGGKDWVEGVAFSPDGHTLATAGGDRTVRLWDPGTGKGLSALAGHEDEVRAVAFSPDGHTLATASDDHSARLWDPTTGRRLHTLTGHEDRVWAVAFSPDGHTLATASDDLSVRLWDPTTGRGLRRLTGHEGGVHAVAFSPDGHTLATASGDHSARLWDATGRELRRLTGHRGGVHAVAFSPDGHTLATAGTDRSVRLWDATGRQVQTISDYDNWVYGVAFSPDGQILATGGDRTVRLWDPATGRELHTLTGHEEWVQAIAFSPDGHTLATAGGDRTVRLWDPATGVCLAVLAGAPEGWIAYTPDGRYKLSGRVGADTFWYVIGLCRFAPGELDPFLPEGTLTRIDEDEPLRRS